MFEAAYSVGDGLCNGVSFMTEECLWYGGDRNQCTVRDPSKVGDGFYESASYNVSACCFDGGNCIEYVIGDTTK